MEKETLSQQWEALFMDSTFFLIILTLKVVPTILRIARSMDQLLKKHFFPGLEDL
jgi:hypothetical protein